MKNKISFEKGKEKEEYKILLKVDTLSNEEYLLYTKDEKNDIDETIVYVGKLEKDNNKEYIIPIEEDEKLEYFAGLLSHIQKKVEQKVGE